MQIKKIDHAGKEGHHCLNVHLLFTFASLIYAVHFRALGILLQIGYFV
jgi:hypothetical protein